MEAETMRKPRFKEYLLVLLTLSLLSVVGSAAAQEVIIAPGEALFLAIASSRDGAAFGAGHTSERGVLLAQEDRPTLHFGGQEIRIELLDADSGCAAETSAAVARAFVEEDLVIGVIGPTCSSSCLAAAPIFDAAGFTSITPTCTAPMLTQQGFTSFHRLVSSDSLTAERAVRFLFEERGVRRLALLYTADENPTFYEGQAVVVAAEVAARGGEIVNETALTADTDYPVLVAEIVASEPDQLYCVCTVGAAAALLAALAEAPADAAALPLMGVELDWANDLLDLAGAAAAGVYVISGESQPSEASRSLANRYQERFGEAPRSPYFTNTYDAYQLFLDAIQAVGELDDEGALHIDRAALNAAIRGTSDYHGVTGPIRCDEDGECLRSASRVYQFQDGVLVSLLTYEN